MEPKEVVRRFVDEYQTGRRREAFDDLLDPNLIDHSRPPGAPGGADSARQQFEAFWAAFPDFRATILDQIAEGDKVVTRKVFHGTHEGELWGIPPTGREVEIHLIDIVRVADGRIVEHWNQVDRMGLMQQLGVLDGHV
jgi:predicted ester cyclase